MATNKFNLFIIFDYLYYAIAYQYYKWYDEEINEFSGILMLSLIQMLNTISILIIFYKFKPPENLVYAMLIGSALFLTINGIRYKKIITYDELHKRWGNDDKKSNLIKKSLVLAYIVLTFVLLIISASMRK